LVLGIVGATLAAPNSFYPINNIHGSLFASQFQHLQPQYQYNAHFGPQQFARYQQFANEISSPGAQVSAPFVATPAPVQVAAAPAPAPVQVAAAPAPAPFQVAPAPVQVAAVPAVPTTQFQATSNIGKLATGSIDLFDDPVPYAAAALEYARVAGGTDICSKVFQGYLKAVMAGGHPDEALAAAEKVYRAEYALGHTVAFSPPCGAAEIAFKAAVQHGEDPITKAAQAYMHASAGNNNSPCTAAGSAFANAFLNGASHKQATLDTGNAFFTAFQAATRNGGSAKDEACTAAAKAYFNNMSNKPLAGYGAAMLAFLDHAFSGSQFDPVCADTAQTFITAYAGGASEKEANFQAANVFVDAVAHGGAQLSPNSPCTVAGLAYVNSLPVYPETAPVKAAMEAFIRQLGHRNANQGDLVCGAGTKAYMNAFRNGATEEEALLAAAEAFFEAYTAGARLSADSPCTAATLAYTTSTQVRSDAPTTLAMQSFIQALTGRDTSDPACGVAASAYIKAYKAGNSDEKSTLSAALAFIREFKRSGALKPKLSPCTQAAKAFSAFTRDPVSPAINTAMLGFIDNAILNGIGQDGGVCLAAAETYINAHLAGKTEEQAFEDAGATFIDAVALEPTFDSGSPCGLAAKTYIGF